jgi:1-phosphatidylinositol-3-phosphate 5-kinase
MQTGCSVPVVVYENEPSSIIAYALSSHEYQRSLDEILARKLTANEQATPRYFILNCHVGN